MMPVRWPRVRKISISTGFRMITDSAPDSTPRLRPRSESTLLIGAKGRGSCSRPRRRSEGSHDASNPIGLALYRRDDAHGVFGWGGVDDEPAFLSRRSDRARPRITGRVGCDALRDRPDLRDGLQPPRSTRLQAIGPARAESQHG